jgi:hypothetical protein
MRLVVLAPASTVGKLRDTNSEDVPHCCARAAVEQQIEPILPGGVPEDQEDGHHSPPAAATHISQPPPRHPPDSPTSSNPTPTHAPAALDAIPEAEVCHPK